MWLLPLLVLGVATAAVPSVDKPFYPDHAHEFIFEQFKSKYNKQYESPEEEQQRFEIFKDNLLLINELNEKHEKTVYAMNKFTDLTAEEFTSMYTGFVKDDRQESVPPTELNVSGIEAPDAFDWRDKGVVTRVKDQGPCGSCWAFGTIGSLESSYAIKTKNLVEFSEQQLVSCDDKEGRCRGGNLIPACQYIMSKGEMSESDYPYEARNGTCKYNPEKVKVYSKNCHDITGLSEEDIKSYLYAKGPLNVALAAKGIQSYHNGIYTDCDDLDVDHAVLLVGYGVEKGTPFWILKNSWGKNFGEDGYFRIQRGNNCIGFGTNRGEIVAVEAK